MHQRDVVVIAKQRDDLLALAAAQQAGIDEDAMQLLAQRLVQQHRRHRAVDPARQAADHAPGADQRAGLLDGLVAEGGSSSNRPLQPQMAWGEVANQRRAVRRVHHL